MGIRRVTTLALMLAGGCFSDSGSETGATASGSSSGTATGTSTEGGTGQPGACPGDAPCVEIPDGWTGPIAVRRTVPGTELTACEIAEYPISDGRLSGDFDPGQAQCTCSCSTAEISQCEPATLERHSSAACGDVAPETFSVPAGTCSVASFIDGDFVGFPAPLPSGTCTAEGTLEMIEDPAFRSEWHSCSAEAPTTCGPGVCVPQIPQGTQFDRLCIRFEGSAACSPGGFFPAEYHLSSGRDVEYSCNDVCTCGPPGPACTARAALFFDTQCSNEVGPGVTPTDCLQMNFGLAVQRARLTALDLPVGLACPPLESTVEAGGQAEATGPVTFCCTQ